jgi:hypothetical protein
MRKRNLRNRNNRNNESGIALLIVLMALFLVAAVGMGMIYMSNTETTINTNYRDTQLAFFSMRGGLEEMRDRMRTSAPNPITLPTAMPSTTAGSIVYITNPGASETVAPATFGSTYFDDEFCHESFTGSGVTYRSPGTPCGSADAPPSAGVTTVASVMPYTGTSSSLKYKWVRVTLKQNGTFPNALVAPIDASHPAASQVCWDTINNKETVLYALGSTYTSCADASAHNLMVEPVYVVTSLAITPQGSRRVGQYETAAIGITPPQSGIALDGSGTNFGPPNSNNGAISGVDGSGTPAPPAVTGCTPTGASVPAIGTSDMADEISDAGAIPNGRIGNYPGTAPTMPTGVAPTPSVVDMGSDAGGTNQLSNWSTPAQLNALAAAIANGADQTVSGCGIGGVGGSGCSGSYGTAASPQITYVDGDVTLNGGAGVLVVAGSLTISGGMQFNGLILVIGQGSVLINGGGDGHIYGSIFVAQTNSSTSPFAQLASLGPPAFTWHGGGKASINYNSCWANIGSNLHYFVIASREEMY